MKQLKNYLSILSLLLLLLTFASCTMKKSSFHKGHRLVDLGLPSGIKWATCNVGANSPEDYGDYFAWGETEPKDYYDFSSYKYCNGSYDTMTKYCTESDHGTVDNKTELELEDDAANANWGGDWRMPTKEEWRELINSDNCTWEWTTQNGVEGYKVTSVRNWNSIFLPAAGYRIGDDLGDAGNEGIYCSTNYTKDYSNYSWSLNFDSTDVHWRSICRDFGQSVRPVCE